MEDISLSEMEIIKIEEYYNKILLDVDINKFNNEQKLEKYPTKFMIEEFYITLKQIIDYYDSKIKNKTDHYLKNKKIIDELLKEIELFLNSDHTFVPDDYLSSWVRTIIRFRILQKDMVELNNNYAEIEKDAEIKPNIEISPKENKTEDNQPKSNEIKKIEELLNRGTFGLNITLKQRRVIEAYLKDPHRGVMELSRELKVSPATVSVTLQRIKDKINPLVSLESQINIAE